MKTMRTRVKSIEELKTICSDDYFQDFYISLANGLARSSKEIRYNEEEDVWEIINGIDGIYFEYSTTQLDFCTNIIRAIDNGNLIHEKNINLKF
tara:strand:+ start:712 stop:993 length:282 start_codon:yes stop_codon:yes gene_type:complete